MKLNTFSIKKISYSPLFEILKQRKISLYRIALDTDLSFPTLLKLKHNKNVSLETIKIICSYLNTQIQEVVRFY